MIEALIFFSGLFALALAPFQFIQRHIFKLASLGSFALFGWSFLDPERSMRSPSFPILEEIGVWFKLSTSGLSWSFCGLILLVSGFVYLYCIGYFKSSKPSQRFNLALLLFTLSMLGLVTIDNIFLFFIFWELTSLSSFILISLDDGKKSIQNSSRVVFLVTFIGGLFLFAASQWMQQIGLQHGLSLEQASYFSALLELDWSSIESSNYIFILMLVAALTKSAQFPFHFWLPQAMTGPTPVSSFLHSATMVKAGIFLMAKLFVAFHVLELWSVSLIWFGLSTALVGALLCAAEEDLKKVLAWSTVSVLGILMMLLGLGTDLALKSFVVFLFAHALYKASLFQVAGSIDKATKERSLDKLGNLFSALKLTGIAGILAALSKAGAPPFFGFIGKELILKSKLAASEYEVGLIIIAVLVNVLLMLMAILVGIKPFFKTPIEAKSVEQPRSIPLTMSLAPLGLGMLGIFIGLFPGTFDSSLGVAMLSSVAGTPTEMDLKLWYGLKPSALLALGLSVLGFAIGLILLWKFPKWKDAYRRFFEKFVDLTKWSTRGLDFLGQKFQQLTTQQFDRSLSVYLLIGGLFLSVLLIGSLPRETLGLSFHGLNEFSSVSIAVLCLTLFIIAAAAVALVFIDRFVIAAIVMGGIGVAIAVIFAWFGAADLAMTQVLAELLISVLVAAFGFGLSKLPTMKQDHLWLQRIAVSLLMGFCVFIISNSAADSGLNYEARDYFVHNSAPLAFGDNIVNVILVDFRALDTLNEVLVVLVAAMGVGALLKRARKRHKEEAG